VIQRKADRGKKANNAAEESDEEQTGVESYTGVGISVSFNSKVLDEQQKIQQLSGGQKSKPPPNTISPHPHHLLGHLSEY
jgi:structural maintenance of chromosome 3 (chondroitin sulfate proteoglycan 6)